MMLPFQISILKLLVFFTGLLSLSLEILGTYVVFLFFAQSSSALAISLASYLLGLGFASYVYFKFIKNNNQKLQKIITYNFLLLACFTLFYIYNYDYILSYAFGFKNQMFSHVIFYILCISFLFIPAFILGFIFPLANDSFMKNTLNKIDAPTGIMSVWDLSGSILGCLLAGFVFIPLLGLKNSFLLLGVLSLLCYVCFSGQKIKSTVISLIVVVAFLALNASGLNGFRASESKVGEPEVSESKLSYSNYKNNEMYFGKVLFQERSPFGTVRVGQKSNKSNKGDENDYTNDNSKILFIDYRNMCGTYENSFEKDLSNLAIKIASGRNLKVLNNLETLPNLAIKGANDSSLKALNESDTPLETTPNVAVKNIADSNLKALNIGLGCGFTAAELVRSSSVSKVQVVEINPSVVKASRLFFNKETEPLFQSDKLNLQVQEGFEYLQNTQELFDIILVDIEEPTILQSSALYTQEGFLQIKERLRLGGVIGMWSFLQPETVKIILNTLRSVFKYAIIVPEGNQVLFYASDKPLSGQTLNVNVGMVREIENIKLDEIATIQKNPYPKYYKLENFFRMPKGYKDPNQIK